MARSESEGELEGDEVTEGSCLDFIRSSWNHLVLSVCVGRGWLDLHFMSMGGTEGKRRFLQLLREGAVDQGKQGRTRMEERDVPCAGLRAELDLGVQDR